MGPCFAIFVFLTFRGPWHRTIRIRIRTAVASHDTMPLRDSGALLGPTGTTSSATHSPREKQKSPRNMPFWPEWRLLGPQGILLPKNVGRTKKGNVTRITWVLPFQLVFGCECGFKQTKGRRSMRPSPYIYIYVCMYVCTYANVYIYMYMSQ